MATRKPVKAKPVARKRRSNTKFKWYDKKDTSFLAIKNKYGDEYNVPIYRVDGETIYTFEIIGPISAIDSGEGKTIKECKMKAIKILASFLNIKNMVNA
jgi:hypothetical protein